MHALKNRMGMRVNLNLIQNSASLSKRLNEGPHCPPCGIKKAFLSLPVRSSAPTEYKTLTAAEAAFADILAADAKSRTVKVSCRLSGRETPILLQRSDPQLFQEVHRHPVKPGGAPLSPVSPTIFQTVFLKFQHHDTQPEIGSREKGLELI